MHTKNFFKCRKKNWAKNQVYEPYDILYPKSIKEIQDRFKKARGEPELGDLINID